jgi:hypothetical protein
MSVHCPLLFQHPTRTWATAAAMLLALVGCGSITAEGGFPPDACSGSVTVTVGSGTTPEFSWSPSCGVGQLIVSGPTGQNWWAGPFRPPVRYGVLPAGAEESSPAEPLVVGKTYKLTLFDGTIFDHQVGSASFTP